MKPRVLVTDGAERAALATVRSLGQSGFHVEVSSVGGRSLSGASRHCQVEHRSPSPLEAPLRFADRVVEICSTRKIDVLLPMTDAALLAILPSREGLGNTRLPFPSLRAYANISDKGRLMGVARDVGIAVPSQTVVERPAMASDLLVGQPALPWVLKPSRSVVTSGTSRKSTRISYVHSREGLGRALSQYAPEEYPLLVQERISGPGIGVFVLMWDGEVVAAFSHQRIREKPPTGGVSVYRKAIPMDPDLLDCSVRLLQRHDWSGVAMIEFKRSSRDGLAYLMEVNGRFWGSLQLAVDAGVNFPVLLAQLALGDSPQTVTEYRTGIRSRWFLGDLDHTLLRIRKRYDASELPPGSGGRIDALLRFLIPWLPGDRSEVLRISDPRPGFREMGLWVKGVFR